MIALTLDFILISIILLFGINIGMAIVSSKLSGKNIFTILVIFSTSIFLTLILTNVYGLTLYSPINQYISEILGFMGLLTLLSAILTIKNWKNQKKSTHIFPIPLISSIICCFISITSVSILLINSGFLSIESNIFLLISLLTIIILSYLVSKFLKRAEKPYHLIIANFMILNGFYFIIAATFIPNLNTLASVQMNPLYINSTTSVFFILIAGVGVFLLGVFLQNRNSSNKYEL
jgi:predicted transporter